QTLRKPILETNVTSSLLFIQHLPKRYSLFEPTGRVIVHPAPLPCKDLECIVMPAAERDSEFQQLRQVSAQDHLCLRVRNLRGQNIVHRVRPGENRDVGAIDDLSRPDFLYQMPYALG